MCGFEIRWIFQFYKIVFIGSKVDIHFWFDLIATLVAFAPVFMSVLFIVVETAQRITVMIPPAAISSVREHLVFINVVANPLIAAIRFCQFFR